MQKKIYVVGMFDGDTAAKVQAKVASISGVNSCQANPDKAQVLVDFNEGTVKEEDINAAIASVGPEVVG